MSLRRAVLALRPTAAALCQYNSTQSLRWVATSPPLSHPGPSSPHPRRSAATESLAPFEAPAADNGLVPFEPSAAAFTRFTSAIATSVHRLVLFFAQLQRSSANEEYVRKVLARVGLDPLDLDLLSIHHPDVFRLSVRHSIEPVVAYLRSQGLTGSGLAHLIASAPCVLQRPVEDHLMPLCEFLRDYLGNRAMGALLRHPPMAEAQLKVLKAAAIILETAGVREGEIGGLIWRQPALFMRLGMVAGSAQGEEARRDGEWLRRLKAAAAAATANQGGEEELRQAIFFIFNDTGG